MTPERVELTEAERNIVLTLSQKVMAAKAKIADLRKQLDEAERAEEIARNDSATGLAVICAVRGLEGNWNVSADVRALVRA